MRLPLLIALTFLSACAAPPVRQAQSPLERIAQYEVRVEEGFGHLDRVPAEWASLPH
jgi:hypothetical protein